jgi:hypothetical protein
MHNSWELAACKTSERFLHQQQQLHTNHHHSSADLQHYASLPAAGAGWYVRSNTGGAGSTADLIAGTTGSNTDGKVTLGVLLGAGELRMGFALRCLPLFVESGMTHHVAFPAACRWYPSWLLLNEDAWHRKDEELSSL